MARLRELRQGRESLPLRSYFGSTVSLDRFSERSLHDLNSKEQSCSKCLRMPLERDDKWHIVL